MKSESLEALRYPIGRFQPPGTILPEHRLAWIEALEAYPGLLRETVAPLDDAQLNTPYRPDGWTVRQLVHHISDSHHNGYIRFKWALTEASPRIKGYDQKAWAALSDARTAPVALSLAHLDVVHAKLVYLLRGLDDSQFTRAFWFPEASTPTVVEALIARYAWHGAHHLEHIRNLIRREAW